MQKKKKKKKKNVRPCWLYCEVHECFYSFLFNSSYVCHMFEKACQFHESKLPEQQLRVESALNIQSSRTTGVATDLAAVKSDVSENSVMTNEEIDGRVNVE
jgi:hypothetical protein